MDMFIHDFGILFLIIVLFSFLIKVIKQPIIIGYVMAGLLFSFMVIDPARSEQITAISALGITFLLFLMGIEFDLKSLKHLGKDILIVTAIQSVIFFGIAFGLAMLFEFGIMPSIYIGILFMFSSTLLVAKWIDDKKETGTLYGKIVLGILVVQDIIAIIALSFLSVLSEKSWIKVIISPLKGILLLIIVVLFIRYALNYLFKIAVKYPELLFIFSLGVCFLFAEIALYLGYSETIGAFLAGITIANTLYKNDVYTRLKPLIVFFNMLFFVGLGFQLKVALSPKIIVFIAILCILSIIVKPIIVYLTLKQRGYDLKTSFIAGLNLAQISEFGMIIITGGVTSGVFGKEIGAIAVISIIATMLLSSYLIKYDKLIFRKFEKHLRKIDEKFKTKKVYDSNYEIVNEYNIIFFGYHEIGKELYSKLANMGKKVLVIENDPSNIAMLKKDNVPYIYHSINSPDFFEKISFCKAELVISSLIDIDDNKTILKETKASNPKSTVILTAKNLKDSLELYGSNADYVICPSYLNEQQISVILDDYSTDITKVLTKKINDMAKLKEIEKKRSETLEKNRFFDIDTFFRKITTRAVPIPTDAEEYEEVSQTNNMVKV